MDRFFLMEVFARVAELESFSKTAESMGISPAAVSVAVRQLETHLEARLLHRTTRRVRLTPEGIRFRERCIHVLSELCDAEQLFRKTAGGVTGTLSINVPTRIASRVIVPALGDFLNRNPGLDVHLGASDHQVNLVEKGVDAVIRAGALRDSGLIARPLGTLSLINCASPGYLARRERPIHLDDLDRHHVVSYSPSFRGAAMWHYVEAGKVCVRKVRATVTVDNGETFVASCLAGLGLIQVPAYDVRELLKSGELVSVMPDYVAPKLSLSLVYPSKRQAPARLETFATWVRVLFRSYCMLD